MQDTQLVIQFAKWPRLGRVKTRLASKLGEAKALRAHMSLSNYVYDTLRETDAADFELWLDSMEGICPGDQGVFDAVADGRLNAKIQHGATLGERMSQAVCQGLASYERVLIIGSDCPSVDSAYVAQAFETLCHKDMVLGPAEDGGYVLVGFSRFKPRVFDSVAWGTASVFQQTIRNADKAGLSRASLATLWDVDDYLDWQRWCAVSAQS